MIFGHIWNCKKNGIWPKNFVKLIYLISRIFLAWTLRKKIFQLCERLKVPKLAQIGALWWPPYGLKVNLKTFHSCESGNICTWWILFWDLGIRLGSLKKNLNSSNSLRKTTLNQFNRMKRRSALSHKKFMHILFIW